ncbi:MAG: amino acid adenylation domain-containing protein, partial [Cyanobacteria bacterium J06635_10]
TLYMTLLAAFQVLLSRYTGTDDILVGSPVAGRLQSQFREIAGYFANQVVSRGDLSKNPSFKEFLSQIRQTVLEALTHQDYPFALLVEKLQPHRDSSRSPIFQAAFALQQLQKSQDIQKLFLDEIEKDIDWGGLKLKPFKIPQQEGQFDLTLEMMEGNSSVKGVFKYNTDLFDESTIERMAGHFQNLLSAILENPDQNVAQLPLLSEAERHQLLVDWNDTATEYPKDKCIHQLFEEQVEKTPQAVAVVFEQEQLTYEQLNQRANQLAHHLQSLGVKPEVLVGICVERSIEMVVGLLGILKAGGAYVPLDPNYPPERLSYMLSDSGVGVLLTQNSLLESLPEHNARVICFDNDWDVIRQQSNTNPDAGVGSDNLAYVIYTSGSTGKPKGAMNTHQGIRNRLLWMQDTYQLNSSDRVLQKTPFSFDVSVWELFWPLLTGARIVVAKPEGHKDTTYLVNLIDSGQITTIHFVPSMLQVFLQSMDKESCSSLKRVFCSGEALPFELTQLFFSIFECQLHNLYGPTEAAIDVTFWQCKPQSNLQIVPIGRPIANTQIYILDKHLQPVPIGVPGELYIGGDGLARGYLNRPQLTQEKFILNPFNNSQRLYKTGDLARYLADGNITFMGRIDNQVKVRGFRIELGEIETVLATHPQIKQAVVIAQQENTGNKRLVAYAVTNSEITTVQLREYLKQKLPSYMIPSAFVTLDTLPLTPNGKIDCKALPVPDTLERDTAYTAPRTPVELKLTQIWSSVLNNTSLGVKDNFFELGGHSLLAVRLMSEIQKQFQKNLPLATLFQSPTIEQLAVVVGTESSQELYKTLVPIQLNGSLPPLFFIPGVGGNVIYSHHLARYLGNNRPFYGLQAQGLDGETQPLQSIEEIAQHYIKAIQTVQPTGPYFLAGHSFGGKVAFEMANQLQRMGESVAYVGILDTSAPIAEVNLQHDYSNWDNARWICQIAQLFEELVGENLHLSNETLASLTPEQQLNYFKQQLEAIGFLPAQTDIKLVRGLLQVFRTQSQIKYEPQNTYKTPITLFRAESMDSEQETSSPLFQEPTWGWNQFSTGEVEIHTVPGNHISMMSEPNVKVLAQTMQQSLEQAQKQNTD